MFENRTTDAHLDAEMLERFVDAARVFGEVTVSQAYNRKEKVIGYIISASARSPLAHHELTVLLAERSYDIFAAARTCWTRPGACAEVSSSVEAADVIDSGGWHDIPFDDYRVEGIIGFLCDHPEETGILMKLAVDPELRFTVYEQAGKPEADAARLRDIQGPPSAQDQTDHARTSVEAMRKYEQAKQRRGK
jgi:hypothetical protein